ncbi:tetratricopeptide repeat protein [Roseibium aestuarii]|uniref:Tetratricopeptide repeat protein n=1 Tax=Roseibium aestuarii TaxID=2600299 RepID=A0ABW4JXQ8_9HYPH|nr:tetratricopeptide repeat protein [Roseibium aestuarii]
MDDQSRAARPLSRRTKALRSLVASGLILACLAPAARADQTTPATEASTRLQQLGTPLDLPLTLSGSYLSAIVATEAQDFAQAAAFYQEALAADPGNEVLLLRTFLFKLANGNFAEALNYARDIQNVTPNDYIQLLAHLTLAADAVTNARFDEAKGLLQPGDKDPMTVLALGISRAWAEAGAGETDKALATLKGLEGPDWFITFTATHEALIAFAAGRKDVALERIEAAHEADKGAIRVIDTYARILAAGGKKDKALEVLAEYDKLLNGHPLLDDTRRAIEDGSNTGPRVHSAAEGMAEILYGLGSEVGRDASSDLSSALLQLALHLDPNATFAAIALAQQFERRDQPERAIEALKQVPESSPLKRQAEIQIGLNFAQLEKVDEARAHLGALIAADPNDIDPMMSLGNILRANKLYEEADAVYDKAVVAVEAAGPVTEKDWNLYYFRGICRERLGRWPEAETDFRKALELQPQQPHVLNYLGYSLVDQGLKLEEALGMIETAAKLRPKDGYIIDSLGWVYYKLGRYEDAVAELERAVDLTPADPVINDHLGDAYWQVGRQLEARFQWSHARDLNPEPDELPKILEKISNGLKPAGGPDEAKAADAPKKNGG